jgi:hypothetical protein
MTGSPQQDSPAATAAGPAPVDTRAVWNQFREAVRLLLEDQPSPNLVRTTARRITHHVLAQAEAEITARDEQSEAELH